MTLEFASAGPAGAEAVLLLHGNGPNWRQFTPQLERWADRWRLIAPSLRGFGRSTAPARPCPRDFSLPTLAGDVLSLLDSLDVGRCHLVGNSVGGLIGLQLLRDRPERLASLTTFGTTAQLDSSRTTEWLLTGLTRVLGARGLSWIAGRTAADRRTGAMIGELIGQADKTAIRLVTRNVARYDYTPTLRASTTPWLLLRGGKDRDINKALATTLQVANARPHTEVHDLSDAGHFANLEAAEDFDRIVEAFMKRNTS